MPRNTVVCAFLPGINLWSGPHANGRQNETAGNCSSIVGHLLAGFMFLSATKSITEGQFQHIQTLT